MALTCAWLAAPGAVRASCIARPPEVLWTYPRDGDQGVPTNATIWLVGLGVGPVEATLNGEPLTKTWVSFGASRWDPPGALEPNTDYALRVWFLDPEVERAPDAGLITFEIAFRTGTATAYAPRTPSSHGFTTSHGFPSEHVCVDVIHAQDCFDTGQDVLATLQVEGDALAWLVDGGDGGFGESTLWPADCGAPAVFGNGFDTCFSVRAMGKGGLLSRAVQVCDSALRGRPVPPGKDVYGLGPMPAESGDSCSTAMPQPPGTHAAGVSFAALVALAAWRRRRHFHA